MDGRQQRDWPTRSAPVCDSMLRDLRHRRWHGAHGIAARELVRTCGDADDRAGARLVGLNHAVEALAGATVRIGGGGGIARG